MKGDYHKWGVWKYAKSIPHYAKLVRGKYYLISSHKAEVRARYILQDCGFGYKVERV